MATNGTTTHTDRLRTELVTVTPAMARHLRDSCHFERQRPLSDSHIRRLGIEVEKGRFIEGTQIHFCVVGGQPLIVNGNHTLEAIATGTAAVPLCFLYTEARSLEEAGRIYARHDIHRARDWLAAIRGAGMAETLEVPAEMLRGYGAAMKIVLGRFRMTGGGHVGRSGGDKIEISTSRDLRLSAMKEYKQYLGLYAASVAGGSKGAVMQLRKGGVMAAAMETFRYQPSAAAEFWRGIAMDDGLRRGDPRKALLHWLRSMSGKQGGINVQNSLAKASARAWNAAYAKEKLDSLRVFAATPFILAGTPWGTKEEPNLKAELDRRVAARPGLVKPTTKGHTAPEGPKYLELGTRTLKGGATEAVAVMA